MKVTLGKIAKEGIEAHAAGNADAVVRAALRRYTDLIESAKPPLSPPPFSAGGTESGGGLEFMLDPEMQAALERQARDASASVEDLAAHAVLLYLAELDAVSAIRVELPADS